MKNKLLKSFIILSLLAPIGSNAIAIGNNPAFNKKVVDTKKDYNDILKSVHDQLVGIIPLAGGVYKSTDLNKSLDKNYAEIGYPSINPDTKEGFVEDNTIDITALKKPITQPSQIELADLLRYYYFSFSDGLVFNTINPDGGLVRNEELKVSEKLNFFDYIKLIDNINSNPNYTEKVRSEKLTEVENDLKSAIDILYGEDRNANARLVSWDDNKNVSIPFSQGKFSYVQLLAAYKKDDKINDTLAFESALLDTLYEIRNYSIQVRQGNDNVGIDVKKLSENISNTFNSVNDSVIKPVEVIITEKLRDEESLEKGNIWQKEQLGKLGLTEEPKK